MIRLVMTCSACPEQYDAYDGTQQVGYLRLRHGSFRVDVPNVGGETIYEANPEGDGCFLHEERDYYLRFAVHAIERWQAGERKAVPPKLPPAPEVAYEVDQGDDTL